MIKSSLFTFLAFISIIAFSQNKSGEIKGYYGEDLKKAAYISGSYIIENIASKPAINKRGIQTVAVLVKADDSFTYQYVGLTLLDNKTERIQLDNYQNSTCLDSIIQVSIKNNSSLNLCQLSKKQQNLLFPYFQNGKITDKEKVQRILNSFEQIPDGFILIEELERGDFFNGTKVNIAPKGIYESDHNAFIYSSYQITIIDTKKLRKIKAGQYVQASADFLPFKIDKNNLNLSDDQLQDISQILTERHKNNIKRSLLLFKVWE